MLVFQMVFHSRCTNRTGARVAYAFANINVVNVGEMPTIDETRHKMQIVTVRRFMHKVLNFNIRSPSPTSGISRIDTVFKSNFSTIRTKNIRCPRSSTRRQNKRGSRVVLLPITTPGTKLHKLPLT